MTPTDQFIQSTDKYVRVLAGPGAGKSFSLKKRLEYLVDNKVTPERILVLTFTSVAVQDLKTEITKLNLGEIEVSTLHSLALRILADEKNGARRMQDFEVKTMLRDLEPEIGKIRKQSSGLNKEDLYKELFYNGKSTADDETKKQFESSLNEWLKQHNGFVLDDVIPHVCDYLKSTDSAKAKWNYDYILVDEYQDLNPDEQEFVEQLLAPNGHLTVIGDDDQSIYGFKGASPEGIREFANNHTPCMDIRFEECYRCPGLIVDKANELIKNNANRIPKTFTALSDMQYGYCECISSDNPADEVDKVCDLIAAEIDNATVETGQIVVLVPIKQVGRSIHEALKKANIPSVFYFRDAVFDNKAVRENFSYLSLAVNRNDLVSWRYLLGEDKGECKAAGYAHIRKNAKDTKRSILEVLDDCANGNKILYTSTIVNSYKSIKDKLEGLVDNPEKLMKMLSESDSGVRYKTEFQKYSQILDRAIKTEWDTGGYAVVRRAVLDEIFSPEASSASNNVRIMSLHAAKGLSAKVVIIMSAVEGLLPLDGKDLEEQRRLFYVAITRCKGGKAGSYPGKLVISTYTESEEGEPRTPSRFIREINL